MSSKGLISASQVSTFLDCRRKWAWGKIENIYPPPHRSAEVGTRVHTILEGWLERAIAPDLDETLTIDGHTYLTGRIAIEGIPLLPPPGPHLTIEKSFKYGHWNGRIDVEYRAENGNPVIMDHKTTSSWDYAKKPEDLETDVQALTYAQQAFAAYPHATHADLIWTYMKTSKPYKAKRVHLQVSREYTHAAMRHYDELALEMIALRSSGLRALQIEPNPSACNKYGGCPHISRCNLSSQELMRGFMTQPFQTDLMAKIAAEKARQSGVAVSQPVGLPAPMMAQAPSLPGAPPALPGAPALPPLPVMAAPALPPSLPVAAAPALPVMAAPALPPSLPVAAAPAAVFPHVQMPYTVPVAAPPPLPTAQHAAPALPPATPQEWVPWPDNPATYQINTQTGQLRAYPRPELNPPEGAHLIEKAVQNVVVEPPKGDESLAGDAYDTKGPDELRAIAKLNNIDVKGLREKALRIRVREGMNGAQRPAPVTPQAAPMPPVAAVQVAPPAPPLPVASEWVPNPNDPVNWEYNTRTMEQRLRTQTGTLTGPVRQEPKFVQEAEALQKIEEAEAEAERANRRAYEQSVKEGYEEAQREMAALVGAEDHFPPRGKRPKFTLLVDTAPTKPAGIVMTVREAFEDVFRDAEGSINALAGWRFHEDGAATIHSYVDTALQGGKGSFPDGAVIVLRTVTAEGALLVDLLSEHASAVYG